MSNEVFAAIRGFVDRKYDEILKRHESIVYSFVELVEETDPGNDEIVAKSLEDLRSLTKEEFLGLGAKFFHDSNEPDFVSIFNRLLDHLILHHSHSSFRDGESRRLVELDKRLIELAAGILTNYREGRNSRLQGKGQ